MNHDLFQDRTLGSLMLELFEDLHVQKSELQESLNEAGALERLRLIDQLAAIDKILADPDQLITATGDALVDSWEKDLEQGKMPDLNAGLPARFQKK